MKNSIFLITFLMASVAILSRANAGPAVLIEDDSMLEQSTDRETNISPLSQRSSTHQSYGSDHFASAMDLRGLRRVGIGGEFAGASGLLGAIIELNFTPEDSFLTGFGGGPGYSSFQMGWHHVFTADKLTPYAGLGYVRWYNSGIKQVEDTNPKFLGNQFLSDKEKATGQYSLNFISPNAGLQYHVLNGEYAGTAVFAEIRMFMTVSHLSPEVLGALGSIYYF